MSICQEYRLLTQEEFQQFMADQEWAFKFLYGNFFDEDVDDEDVCTPEEGLIQQGRFVDIQKEWQAIYFLLTGKIEYQENAQDLSPLESVIMGGHNTEIESSYGYYRYFTTTEIEQIAEVLAKINAVDLKELHKDKFAQATDLYANQSPDKWEEEYWQFIFGYFNDVKGMFIKAARENYIVMVAMV